MSQWGIFFDVAGERHVAPVNVDQSMAGGHLLTVDCDCSPKLAEGTTIDAPIWVHNDRERGGYAS